MRSKREIGTSEAKSQQYMDSIEQKSVSAFLKWRECMSKPSKASLEELQSLFHPNCRSFGTTKSEWHKNKDEIFDSFNEQFRQAPDGFNYQVHWLDCRKISDSVCEIFTQISVFIKSPRGEIPYGDLRISAVLQKAEDNMLITHFHTSLPDQSATEEEYFPGAQAPKVYNDTSILFTDFVGFTKRASLIPPKVLVGELDDLFSHCDLISKSNNLIKIKTIGDAYMAVSGLQDSSSNHALSAVIAAKQILELINKRNANKPIQWDIRIGIHSGPLIGGVIGKEKLVFDVWGDTVNLANAMEQSSEAGKINISKNTFDLIKERYSCQYRGKIPIKGGRKIDMYFIQ